MTKFKLYVIFIKFPCAIRELLLSLCVGTWMVKLPTEDFSCIQSVSVVTDLQLSTVLLSKF